MLEKEGMGISRFLVSNKMQALANELVGKLLQTATTSSKKNRSKPGVDSRDVESSLGQLYDEAIAVVTRQKMGALRRASFAFAIQQALLDRGFSDQIASKVTSALVMNALIGKQSPPSPKK